MTEIVHVLPSEAEKLLLAGCLIFTRTGTYRFDRAKGLGKAHMTYPDEETAQFAQDRGEIGCVQREQELSFRWHRSWESVLGSWLCCRREDFERHQTGPITRWDDPRLLCLKGP